MLAEAHGRLRYRTVQSTNVARAGSVRGVSGPSGSAPPTAARPPGRPRSGAVDAAILDAALRLLAEAGYSRMTMDAVAAEAGVSKATIYLRYRGKADLATAALVHMRGSERPGDGVSLRDGLVTLLRQMRANAERVSAMGVIGTCLAEERHTPELLRLVRERTLGPRRERLAALLVGARERGEVAAGADLEAAADMLMGAYQARYLAGGPIPPGWEERLVDTLLAGLAAS